MKKRSPEAALQYCIDCLGGRGATAKAFGLGSDWAVGRWLKFGIPADRVLEMVGKVRANGGEITCYQLRPDKFPKEQQAA